MTFVPRKFLIVHWHPEPKSMCASIFRTTAEHLKKLGHEVKVSDLHEMNFNPVSGKHNFVEVQNKEFFKQQLEEKSAVENGMAFSSEIKAEMDKLLWCDYLILTFPLWWFSLPASTKGWVDRVFASNWAYGGNIGIYDTAKTFKGKKAMLVFTTGGPDATYQPDGFNGDIDGIVRPIHRGILEFCGFSVLKQQPCYAAAHGTDEDRQKWLAGWQARLEKLTEEEPVVVGRYH